MTRFDLTNQSYLFSRFFKPSLCTAVFTLFFAVFAVAGNNFFGPGIDIEEEKDNKLETIKRLTITAEETAKKVADKIASNAGNYHVEVDIKNSDPSGTSVEAKVSLCYTVSSENASPATNRGRPVKNSTGKKPASVVLQTEDIRHIAVSEENPCNEPAEIPENVEHGNKCNNTHNAPLDWKFIIGMILIPIIAACINKKWGASK